MTDTKNKNVNGFIDVFDKSEDHTFLKGWCFHNTYNICSLRVKYTTREYGEFSHFVIKNDINDIANIREDVVKYFNFETSEKLFCGWEFTIPHKDITSVELEMFFDGVWNTIFTFEKYFLNYRIKNVSNFVPSFVVVDNFYENPDSIRNFALTKEFHYHVEYHKGKRTDEVYLFPGLKESFEDILHCKIKDFHHYGVNGCFQYCIAGDQLVYHYDGQEYAGIIFLTPNAPPQAGTSFYRSKHTKNMKCNGDDHIVFNNGYLDPTEFEVVDVVGNVYNRLVLFDAKMFHAASTYFGNTKENGRLFQLFFFDLER